MVGQKNQPEEGIVQLLICIIIGFSKLYIYIYILFTNNITIKTKDNRHIIIESIIRIQQKNYINISKCSD